ncbi:hypothetical protein T492DRAFT_966757, partial [Pavlovales sp. CCMP2436]
YSMSDNSVPALFCFILQQILPWNGILAYWRQPVPKSISIIRACCSRQRCLIVFSSVWVFGVKRVIGVIY